MSSGGAASLARGSHPLLLTLPAAPAVRCRQSLAHGPRCTGRRVTATNESCPLALFTHFYPDSSRCQAVADSSLLHCVHHCYCVCVSHCLRLCPHVQTSCNVERASCSVESMSYRGDGQLIMRWSGCRISENPEIEFWPMFVQFSLRDLRQPKVRLFICPGNIKTFRSIEFGPPLFKKSVDQA